MAASVASDRLVQPKTQEEAAEHLHRRIPLNCLALARLREILSKRISPPAIDLPWSFS